MVLVVSMPLASGAPPTRAAKGLPVPASPWHTTHFCAKIFAPCAGVPLPGGSPAPLGMTWTSQAAMSASEIGLPSLGVCASAAPQPSASPSARTAGLGVNMAHLPVAVDRPARDAVVVLVHEAERVGDRLLRL